jgi:hypothetical protein
MTVCIQSVAIFGSELWWKRDHRTGKWAAATGQPGRPRDHGLLPNNQPGNACSGVEIQTCGSPARKQTAEVRATAARSPAGRPGKGRSRYPNGHWETGSSTPSDTREAWRVESCWRSRRASTRARCRRKRPKLKQRCRPGLATLTDGSQPDSGAAGYSVVWKSGQSSMGIEIHMGYKQEAYDAECAALARELEMLRGDRWPRRVPIFTDSRLP